LSSYAFEEIAEREVLKPGPPIGLIIGGQETSKMNRELVGHSGQGCIFFRAINKLGNKARNITVVSRHEMAYKL
jgi:hypothetical protein